MVTYMILLEDASVINGKHYTSMDNFIVHPNVINLEIYEILTAYQFALMFNSSDIYSFDEMSIACI